MPGAWIALFRRVWEERPHSDWGRSQGLLRDEAFLRRLGRVLESEVCTRRYGVPYAPVKAPPVVCQERWAGANLREDVEMALRRGDVGDAEALIELWGLWAADGTEVLHALEPAIVVGATVSVRMSSVGVLGVTVFFKDARERFQLDSPTDADALRKALSEWVSEQSERAQRSASNKRKR